MKVNVLPGNDWTFFDCRQQFLTFLLIGITQFLSQVKVIPADNRVFDQLTAAGNNILFFFFSRTEFLIVAEGDGFSEFVGVLDFIQLFFDWLAQNRIVNVAQNENRFNDFPEFL